MSLRWRARGTDGDLQSSNCTVIITITGPDGYDEQRRSAECTGRPGSVRLFPKALGTYTISVSIVPPSGGPPMLADKTFELVG
ncbi:MULTISPECIES: hypothetical protein [unclassified Nocardia]|uniref:hypothetical protein n=1 Tax=unclassified Nocardia TaxID=2637762 RepID=UPI0024A99233|nr:MULTISPECIES: hypothetical protein [unclassified Nocardia]